MTTEIETRTAHHEVDLWKGAARNLQAKVIESNLRNLCDSVNSRALQVRGWRVEPRVVNIGSEFRPRESTWNQRQNIWNIPEWREANPDAAYRYEMYLQIDYKGERDPERNEFNAILRTINTRCVQPGFGRWELAQVDGEPYVPPSGDDPISADAIGYAPILIPDDWDSYFDHLYGLDSHIARVRRAIEAGSLSDWNNRYHCALVGPPGCGKSDICQSLKRALGEDAVLEFDATATTAAGAIKELTERDILPRILIVEEIEKADEKAMSFLLSVLDLRSQIRKTTARATVQRDTKLFAIATVNDVPLFERLQAGALASRFSNTIWFKRPDRAQLEKILMREVVKIEGDLGWIEPALDYCEQMGISDPRKVTALCLCGRDMLLDGSYQQMLKDTAEVETEQWKL